MTVSDRERRHFVRIAEAKRVEREARALEALAEPAMKRIIDGLVLGDAVPRDAATDAMLELRTLGQAGLHARARRLGLIR